MDSVSARSVQHEALVGAIARHYSEKGRRWEVLVAYGPATVDVVLLHMDRPETVLIDVKTQQTDYNNIAVEASAADRYEALRKAGTDVQVVTVVGDHPVVAPWSKCWHYRNDVEARTGSLNGSGRPFYTIPHSVFTDVCNPDWWTTDWFVE